ncbi:phosphotransferase enzyme family protein [Aspergillus pseudonomiae]|uniref:Altered inheritance of mitochondria protein 9, mitochondrial n=1 Tax=Aspergillus pseudonomiae TaxID=1506151 RepID=A0A5N7DRL4_9EURO|nr:phosphotransferase enzyme family protein [Aspergillus pseudonomiae]KAE8409110.1 phosphotransferase enzyme family protein [Aspergillus pseudonomiae]
MKALRGHFLRRPNRATFFRRGSPQDGLLAPPFSSSRFKINETQGITDPQHDLEALNRFTSGRWLWNERQQLACRYVKFDLSTLLQLAASAIGSRSCTQVLMISEGQYNKVFSLTMDDGRVVIAKLPNPNAGRPHFTTASEVATMDFLRNVLNLPVPRVYAWSSRASENPLGAEYILMEKQAGVALTDVWDIIKGKQKVQILDQVVDIERRLAATKFSKFGSLYYKDDLPDNSDSPSPLYFDSAGNEVRSKMFGMGPINHRSFFDFGRGTLNIDRGPWSTVTQVMTAIAQREIATAKAGLRYPLMPEGLYYGPRQYQPSLSKKLSALENYLKNIFVDPVDPSRIVGMIDWQSVSACPLFMQVGRPAFLHYNGPVPEDLGKVPLPPNFDSMGPDEQRKAKALHRAQTLHNLYVVRCLQVNETIFQAIQKQNTLRHQVSVVPGLVLMDYEPLLNSLLRDVEKEWPSIQQDQDGELWAQGVELMDAFVGDTGCFKHWDGRVSDVDYEKSRTELDEGVKRFLDREARDDEECREWLKALPFVD